MRAPLDCDLTAGEMLRLVRAEPMAFALVGRWAGVAAVVGFGPASVASGTFPPDVEAVTPSDAAVGGGWFGYLGFGLGAQVERLPPPPPRPVVLPDAVFGWYPSVLVLDREGRWWFEALADDDDARARLASVRARIAAPLPPRRAFGLSALELHGGGADAHRAAVAECVERIAAGELFQANLCVRLDGAFAGDPAAAFEAAAASLNPAYGAFFDAGDGVSVLSFSPELFLRRTGRSVVTAPIKGTAPRVAGSEAARDALAASAKDAAEHVMIVDLMRNDLGRVAEYGTVVAEERPAVEAHPGVWHLVTRVRATLREDVGDTELLRATFPPGSVTGAPKVQALKVISELEGTGREVYTGAVGYVSPVAGLELNVAIRTLEVRGSRAWLGCGGGIVADSDPDAELREALDKARPIAAALGATVPDPPATPAAAPIAAVPLAPGPALPPEAQAGPRSARPDAPPVLPRIPRPDPGAGVFTTIAVRDGRPVELERHLRRLAHSARVLYGLELPADLAWRAQAAVDHGDHRLRVAIRPDGRTSVTLAPVSPGPPADVTLTPVTVTGGLGEHKWADRSSLAAHPDALIVDLDGSVLEAAWANVWIVEEDRLITPPADGRVLPGVMRELLLERGDPRIVEEPLTLDRVRAAEAIVLTSSIRLATPAGLDGAAPTARARRVAGLVRAALQGRAPVASV